MAKIAVVSSCYGEYDSIYAPPEQTVDCEWVLVTDSMPQLQPSTRSYRHPSGMPESSWQVRIEPRPQLHPRTAAKVAKCRPDWYADADIYLWIDSSIKILSAEFVQWATSFLEHGPLAMKLSRARKSIIAEAEIAQGMQKYQGLPVLEQAQHYLSKGYPDDWGVWGTGLMARCAECPNFGDAWLAEQIRWTYEDQISLPWVLWNMNLRPVDLSIDFDLSDMLAITSHRDAS